MCWARLPTWAMYALRKRLFLTLWREFPCVPAVQRFFLLAALVHHHYDPHEVEA